jgi:carbonic anhydrase
VKKLSHTAIVQKAWNEKKQPYIHGWVYDLNNGLVKQLITLEPGSQLDSAYRYDF